MAIFATEAKFARIPVTNSVTVKRGQEILAGTWYAGYEAIKIGEPCRDGGHQTIDARSRREGS